MSRQTLKRNKYRIFVAGGKTHLDQTPRTPKSASHLRAIGKPVRKEVDLTQAAVWGLAGAVWGLAGAQEFHAGTMRCWIFLLLLGGVGVPRWCDQLLGVTASAVQPGATDVGTAQIPTRQRFDFRKLLRRGRKGRRHEERHEETGVSSRRP